MGEIKIMAHSPQGITVIQSGQRVAQLILLPTIPVGKAIKQERGSRGFGSSDAYWIQAINKQRPELLLYIQEKPFKAFWILVQMFLSYLKNIGLMNGLSRL